MTSRYTVLFGEQTGKVIDRYRIERHRLIIYVITIGHRRDIYE